MRIATWNVCTLYRGGALNELAKYLENYTIDVLCAVQEIRWPGKVTVGKKRVM
jgi:exonuclease III